MDVDDWPWDPWRALSERPEIELWFGDLGPSRGAWQVDLDGELIVLDSRLSRRERRCVLAHELVHAERRIGLGMASAATMLREEYLVRRETARRLVPPVLLSRFIAQSTDCSADDARVDIRAIADAFDVTDEVASMACTLVNRCGENVEDRRTG